MTDNPAPSLPDLALPELPQRAGDRRRWGQVLGGAGLLAVAAAARQQDGLVVALTPDSQTAEAWTEALPFYLGADADYPVWRFPDWETLPYDSFSPHEDIVSDRLESLYQLLHVPRGVLVVPVTTLMQRLPPVDYLGAHSLVLTTGQRTGLDSLRKQLSKAGYRSVDTVYEHGEFAVRGSLVDIYPMGSAWPFRVDLFDDEVDSLRTFDPETQRTVDTVSEIRLLPGHEFPLDRPGIATFRDQWHQRFEHDPRECSVYVDVSDGLAAPGVEYYLPLFFETTATLFDYLPEGSLLISSGDLNPTAEQFWREANSRYESRRHDITRPVLSPAELFTPVDELFQRLSKHPRIELHAEAQPDAAGNANLAVATPPALPLHSKADNPLSELETFLAGEARRTLFVAESPGRREALLGHLQKIGVTPEAVADWPSFAQGNATHAMAVAPLDQGLWLPEAGIALITEAQLFGARVRQERRRRASREQADNVVKHLTELAVGAPVVHLEHGVGRYRGLATLDVDGQANEFLLLEYADGAKLYVPVADLHLISRYSGADEALAPWHKLGSEQWQKAKRKAAEKIHDVAAELLDIYARRAAREGFQYQDPEAAYATFAEDFPFEETADQLSAIDAVRADMLAKQPMDRLVCGDVGFGKTEVAMRAAFIAVHNRRQVAVLVPTTLLAQQHFDSFRDRFADWPVTVEMVSRFRTAKEQSAILERLQNGDIDIIIGTHKLLQAGINFRELGLVIIDEEHRFGVRQKETLKALRAEVDILTLTATPIPRTLNMAMSHLRDLSIIATAPAKRLSVKTFVRPHDEALIKEAILRELLRGGQVYVLHNEVKTIEQTAAKIRELVPEARVGIGHGQLRERELERVMSDFYHKRFNVLVCSTIIETGIDVPSANTIIIERADKFGLAQLHQLRGRVGRSHHQAYAYLLTPHGRQMTADAVKRLEAISAAQDLGAGFTLATHDLEIRGAGELLGDEQSGQIQAIGFNLYMDMLDRAVKAIRDGKQPSLDSSADDTVEVNLRIPALIPEDYLPDVHSRLILYKRIASADSETALDELQVEMIDRFGLLPEPAKNLIRVTQIKLQAQRLGIEKVEASINGVRLEFSQHTQIDPLILVEMVQRQPQRYRLEGGTQLKMHSPLDNAHDRLQAVEQLFTQLRPREEAA